MNEDFICYFNDEDQKRLARMLMLSRAESGLSQEKVALELGIAKKTVQNWEKGASAPTLPQAVGWFRVMKVAAMPYFIQFLFPNMEVLSKKEDVEKLRKEMISMLESLPPEGIKQLMYVFYGEHGSSPRALINLLTAHLQTPLRDRYNHANMIISDYEIAKEKGELHNAKKIQPDMDVLNKAMEQGRKAIINNKDSYLIVE